MTNKIVRFLPSHFASTQSNPQDQYHSIWGLSPIVTEHTWAVRALQGYSAVVTIQRKVKIWIHKKKVSALHSLLPGDSSVYNTILNFLCYANGPVHPTLLISETSRGALYVLAQVRTVPLHYVANPHIQPPRALIQHWPVPWDCHFTERFVIPLGFSRAYNIALADSALLTPGEGVLSR